MLNMNFDQRVVINTHHVDWIASPKAGVWRKPLAREEAERGHATSVVRYDPGASFSAHDHPLGEEILVLEGIFSDETGDYPAGTYFRNPEGFRHAPFSKEGCLLFVKLHQFQTSDNQHVCIDTNAAPWQSGNANVRVLPLHKHKSEYVALVRWLAGEPCKPQSQAGGEEIFVIRGELITDQDRYPSGTWMRSSNTICHNTHVEQDTLIWLKTGHLA